MFTSLIQLARPLRSHTRMFISLLLLTSGTVSPAWAQPTSPDAVSARVTQEELPALEARRLAAEARTEAALSWFAGSGTWVAAFPDWEHQPLLDRTTLIAARAALEAETANRAHQRIAPLPEPLPPRDREQLAAARAAACDAEDRADQLARRFLAGLDAGLQLAPDLGDDTLGAWVHAQQAAVASDRALLATAPEDPEALARVQHADGLSRLHGSLRQALIALWTVPGSPRLAEWGDQALASGVDAPSLWVPVLPLLGPEQVDAATERLEGRAEQSRQSELRQLQAQVDALTLTLATPAATPDEDLSSLQSALARAELSLDLAEAAGQETTDTEHATLTTTLARLERDLAQSRLARAQEQLASETASDQEAEQQADAATRAAEAAQARVDAAGARGRDDTLERLLKTQRDHVALVRKTDLVLLNAARDARTSLGERLEKVRTTSAGARSMPPLAKERQPAMDSAYRESVRLVEDVRHEVSARQAALVNWRATMARLEEDLDAHLGVDPGTNLATTWRSAGQDLRRAMDDRLNREVADLDRALGLLADARAERSVLRDHASQGARDQDARRARDELTTEILEMPTHVASIVRRATGAAKTVRANVGDLEAVQRFLAGLAGTLVLLGVWVLTRPRLEDLLRALLREARGRQGTHRSAGLLALVRPAAPVLALSGDALVAAIFLGALGARWPMFRVLLWALLVRRLVQVAPLAVRLALATPSESRAALSVTTESVRDLLALSVRWLVLWWGALALIDVVVRQVLWAELLNDWLQSAGAIAGILLACWLIWRWGPTVEERIKATDDPNAFVSWLGRPEGGFTLRAVRAVLGTIWLLLTWLTRLLDSQERTSWIGSALARRHLRERAGEGIQRPPEALLATLRIPHTAPAERTAALQALTSHFEDWQREGREGLIAVTGDRGAGKGQLLQAAAPLFADSLLVRQLRPPEHHLRSRQGLTWLASATGIPQGLDKQSTIAALLELPATAWLVNDLQRLFLRQVGGFTALQDVLVVMRQTAHHHLWVVGCHAPTWQYLSSVRLRVPLEAFRGVIKLEPLGPDPLAKWILARTATAALRPDFRPLSTASPLGGDPVLALQRATHAYWRLLADSSEGNPEVAYELWLASLHRSRKPGVIGVGLPPTPTTERLGPLTDVDLFVLAALIVHDGLPLTALTEVLNMPASQVRTSCRSLLAQGVVTAAEEQAAWYVCPPWRPTVHRMLRQKHVLRGKT